MFVNEVSDIKIYNLSAGKSVPDWLLDRRKRSQSRHTDSRRQIELIQDFEMPTVCTSICMTPDQQYIIASGTYKPRMKCFELCNLSIKFERCFDSEVTCLQVLSDDYSKIAFLQCDRFVEIHAAHGRHFRLRVPSFGRDMKYQKSTCDLLIAGNSNEIYRLNLERGQFLQPFTTSASSVNACDISSDHQILMAGTSEGIVEAWDPRVKSCCASLDVAIKLDSPSTPSISAIKYKNALQMGVGTATGHVLLYDLRSREPILIKNHLNKMPIKRIAFNDSHQAVYSLDECMLKLWDENTGKSVGYIEANTKFNDFCNIPDSGIFFLAQEDVKMLTYYIPTMGPAPKWCSFLDNLTEEIESEVTETMYDDYQFVTQKELDQLGLEHLIGTNLLKGYMHGYFMNVRLYNKAKASVDAFAFDRFRKEKILQEIESERQPRIKIQQRLPKINQELALKILEQDASVNNTNTKSNLLEDERFKAMFENSDFTINKNDDEYKLLAPVLNHLEKSKIKENKKRVEVARVYELHKEEADGHEESDKDSELFDIERDNEYDSSKDESTDDENLREMSKEFKKAYRKTSHKANELNEDPQGNTEEITKEKQSNHQSSAIEKSQYIGQNSQIQTTRVTLEERLRKIEKQNANITPIGTTSGNRQMTFTMSKDNSNNLKKRQFQMKKHMEERKKVVRSIKSLKLKKVNFK